MSIYLYESLKLRKAEQNKIANRFFKYVGGGFGLSKIYECLLCQEKIGAPSPRLAAKYHSHKHPEITEAFRKAGLYELWKE